MKKVFVLILSVLLLAVSCKQKPGVNNPTFTVYAQDDGLKIVTTCEAKYVHSYIEVYDIEAGAYNLSVETDDVNEFLYPFVQAGKDYEVLVYLYEDNGSGQWINRKYVGWADITATGGKGDYRVFANGMSYDGNNTVSISNYEITRPDTFSASNEYSYGYIYTTSENDVWTSPYHGFYAFNSWKLGNCNTSAGVLSITNSDVISNLTGSEKNFWVNFSFGVNYEGNSYKNTYDPLILFTYQKKMEKFSTIDNMVKVEIASDGFNMEKWYNANYPNTRITVYNETRDYECPRVVLDYTYKTFIYDYLNAGDVYSVKFDRWTEDWSVHYSSKITGLKATGGKGDITFKYDDAEYIQGDDPAGIDAILRLSNADFSSPKKRNPPTSYTVNGNLWLVENNKTTGNVWDSYPYDTSVVNTFDIDISKTLKSIMGKEFWPEIVSEWDYEGFKYQLTLIDDDTKLYKDEHVLGEITLKDGFNVLPYGTTFKVPEELQGKKAFLIKLNSNSSTISDSYPVTNVLDMEARLERARSIAQKDINEGLVPEVIRYEVDYEEIDPGEIIGPRPKNRGVTALYDYSDYKVDETTIHFNEIPEGEVATLKAIGQHCNVWYYNNNQLADDKLMAAIADEKTSFKTLADKFDNFYEYETYFIGSNVPTVIRSNVIDIDESAKIDIFVFDLDELYNGKQTGGVFGYFWGKDLYKKSVYSNSNEREMFYIDSAFLGLNPAYMYSTLAHEFQHLLNSVNKGINKNIGTSSWFTEMMSVGIEDVLQVACLDYNSNEAISSRVSQFNGGYNLGFVDWKNIEDKYGTYNYANAAIFMDFLMKNFGGPALIYEIAHNNYGDAEAVTKALQKLGYTNETFETVMLKMGQIIPNAYKIKDGTYYEGDFTLNKHKSYKCTINGKEVTFKFNALDLLNWAYYMPSGLYSKDDRYYLNGYSAGGYYAGPAILKPKKTFKEVYADAITVNFISTGSDTIKVGKAADNVDMAIFFVDAQDPQ